MLTRKEIGTLAKEILIDSEILYNAKRYKGAIYLCGYALEFKLKSRICKTLNWQGFPFTKEEFKNLQSFKTHSLEVLLRLSGMEEQIKVNYFAEWSAVAQWDPNSRYEAYDIVNENDAKLMIGATKKLLGIL